MSEWIDVDKELPNDARMVLVWNGIYIQSGFLHKKSFWKDRQWEKLNNVTHWIDYPEPPKKDK